VRDDRSFERRVREIVQRVKTAGDRALVGFAKRFDGVSAPLEVTADEMRAGAALVDPDVRRALRQAARSIARVAFRQIPKHWDLDVVPGVSVEQRVEPLARVGCYVPGGRFPLPSSLLMTAVPARVAGVREIIVVCPRPEPAVMAAALEAGVTRLFRVGGSRDRRARLLTATIPRVDVGPGNRYVAAAKRSSPAAARSTSTRARPRSSSSWRWPAGVDRFDLIAQAEHDPDARAIIIRGAARSPIGRGRGDRRVPAERSWSVPGGERRDRRNLIGSGGDGDCEPHRA
jgi:histidinol dehydrogenase